MNIVGTLSTIANSLSDIALVIPQVNIGYQPTSGADQLPPALMFHYEGENIVSLESEITDHWVENNSPIEDHIGLLPEQVTVHGYIGEVNNVLPTFAAPFQQIANALPVVQAFSPQISLTAQLALQAAQTGYQAVQNIANLAIPAWGSINGQGQPNQTKQQMMFTQFYGYRQNRMLFKIQTPWAIFENMAILSLRAIQDESTRMITDFHVVFKKIRKAQVIEQLGPISVGSAAAQSATKVDNGTNQLPPGPGLGTFLVGGP